MSKKLLFIPLLGAASYLQAQTSTDSVRQLDQVVITAAKYPQKTSETGKVLTVISRDQLNRSAGKSLSQLLTEQAGLVVNGAYSNPGKDKAIFLRGAKPEYTLILIDGVPVYDASSSNGNFDLRTINIDQVERVEILKGSQSTLYGSDAIAGVINIITRKGGKKSFSPFATATWGSYNTRKLNAGVSGGKDAVSYNAGFTHYKTDGISEASDPKNTGTYGKNGFEQNALNVNVDVKASDRVRLSPYFRYSKSNGSLDAGAFQDDKDYTYSLKNMQSGLKTELDFGKVKVNVLYNYNLTQRDYLDDSVIKESPLDGFYKGYYKAREHFVDAYTHVSLLPSLSFTGGVDYRRSQADMQSSGIYKYMIGSAIYSGSYQSNISGDSARQDQESLYGALIYTGKGGFNAEAGARFNHHSAYGNNSVFNLNPSLLIGRQLKIFVNISSAYKVPTLFQLYSEYRNKMTTLQPEKAITYEGGVQYALPNDRMNLRVAVFRRDIRDGIAFYTDPATYASYYINQDKQRDWGFEIEPSFQINKQLQLLLSYAYVDGKLTTKLNGKDSSYFNLIRRPKNVVTGTLNYHITPALFASLNAQYIGKKTDIDFSTGKTVDLSDYTLVNFYAEYTLPFHLKVFVDLKNLLNKSYAEVLGYNTLGRNYNAGISIHL